MQTTEKMLLKDYNDNEKGAYLGAIASLATADHAATPEEVEYLNELADAAGISEEQKRSVERAATELSDTELRRCLEILKDSELRFSLVADLIQFSESDSNYSESEKKSVENIAGYLNVSQEQFSLLDQFVKKSAEVEPQPADVEKPGFLASLGLQDKFQNAGINWKRFLPGLLGIAGPMLLGKMLGGRNRGNNLSGGGLGSMFGGSRGMGMGGAGGIGSLISMLSGGRGLGNMGGLLSGLFKGRR